MIVAGGTVVLALVIIFAVIRPMWATTSKTLDDIKVKKETMTKLSEKLENLKSLKTKEADLKEKNAKVLAALPKDNDVARLFVQLEEIAAQSGVTVSQTSEQGAAVGSSTNTVSASLVKPVSYQLSASANSYEALKNTLNKFEQALRILSISSIDVSKNNNQLGLTFGITTYVRSSQ